MPRPCAVEPHVCRYKVLERIQDATALCRGASRLSLQRVLERIQDATALCRGASRLSLQSVGTDSGCHGLVPWSLTIVATKCWNGFRMPRPCAVEPHDCRYKVLERI